MRNLAIVSAGLIALWSQKAQAIEATWEYAVQVSARVETSPARITLTWPQDSQNPPSAYTVYRKAVDASTWGKGTILPGSSTSYVDANVTGGSAYEYQIVKSATAYTGYGYICAGIEAPVSESRGKVLLLVDDTVAGKLSSELTRLQQDMLGDGWTVIRQDVPRTESPTNIKAIIKREYAADPANLRTLFLFGHIPVPYSGSIVPDGHYPDHQGAWACDAYYGDMDGHWTDNSVNNTSASDQRNRNIPGDGKFDQSDIPSPVELQVGRVDFANLPGKTSWDGAGSFPSEVELLRNYLNKDHNWRHKRFSVPSRGIIYDDFGIRGGEAFAASAYRNFGPFFGADGVVTLTNQGTWISTLKDDAYLWAYGCGAGSYTSIGGLGSSGQYRDGTTLELVRSDIKAVFTILMGSWLGDWDSEDNFMRAVLATTHGLSSSWSGRPHWFYHHVGLGFPLGHAARLAQNNGPAGLYRTHVNSAAGQVHIALMGDPTLRMHVVAPPSNLVAAVASQSGVSLRWNPSSDAAAAYHVYRAANPSGPFTRMTGSLLKQPAFEDTTASGASTYMVRAVKLEQTPSGSYYNPSQGIFATVMAPQIANTAPQPIVTPTGPTNSPARSVTDNVTPTNSPAPASPSSLQMESNTASNGGGSALLTPTSLVAQSAPLPPSTIGWVDDNIPGGATGGGEGGDSWTWVMSNPAPFSGTRSHQSGLNSGMHQHFFNWAGVTLSVEPNDHLFAYIYLDPANPPSEVMLQWTDGNWDHRAYWGGNHINLGDNGTVERFYAGALPTPGQWARLEVPAEKVGLAGRTIKGMAFTLFGGRATWDLAGKSSESGTSTDPDPTDPPDPADPTNSPPQLADVFWVDDDLPTGATAGAQGGDTWNWNATTPAAFKGSRAVHSGLNSSMHQLYFDWAQTTLKVDSGDKLIAHVYLDPANRPSEVMLQWTDGSWEHRAYWGQNQITYGANGTAGRRYMGPLPEAGKWVRLEVPASDVGLAGRTVRGMGFSLYGGRASWDAAGKSSLSITTPTNPPPPGTNVVTNPPPGTNVVTVPPSTNNDSGVIITNTTPSPTNGTVGTTNGSTVASVADYVNLQLPKPGDHTLHVLAPTLLELKVITSKDPDPARVSLWDWIDANYQFAAPALQEFTVTANGQAIQVSGVGFRRRPLYAPLAKRDLRVDNSLFLKLASPIADGQRVEVKNASAKLWPATMQFVSTADPLRFNPAIHVNQEGYVPNFPKKAMVGYYLGNLGEMTVDSTSGFKIVSAANGAVAYEGTLKARVDVGYGYTPTPYQKVLEADFSTFTTPGEYRLFVPGLGASLPFMIHDGIAMNFARTYALGLYHQRCGTSNSLPFARHTHEACHLLEAQVPTPQSSFAFTWSKMAEKNVDYTNTARHTAPRLANEASQLYPFVNKGKIDISGGHHDAGDYSKYTINAAALVHYLMFAVDSFAGVAALDNMGLPESGDGISDLMQEAKWEADFLAKFQDADGGFYFLCYPQNRAYENNVLPDQGDPQLVWPKNTAVTAAAVAALAQCAGSPIFKQNYPAEAAIYLEKAKLGWQFLMNAIAKHGKDGAYQKITHYGNEFMHDDELAWAACELFVATGDEAYHQKLKEWFDPSARATFRWSWWRMWDSYGRATRSYAFAARSGRLAAGNLDATYLAKCEEQVKLCAQDHVTRAQSHAYGSSFPIESKRYRVAGWYFSSERAFDISVAYQLEARPEFLEAIVSNLNYEGGCNPVNASFVTGLGWKRQREVVHQYAQNDRRVLPPSGIPIGNIQEGFTYMERYKRELGALCFPQDGVANSPYPFYDRWSDAYNLSAEFVHTHQARSLASLAFLATLTPVKDQPWKPVAGKISIPGDGAINTPRTATVEVPGLDLNGARIVWEAAGNEPAYGPSYTVTPTNHGTFWVEAEIQWPDGRRVFAVADAGATNSLPTITIAATQPTASEYGRAPGIFTFTRSGSTERDLLLNLQFSGTAAKWHDYRRLEGDMPSSVIIPAGAASLTLTIYPVVDTAIEGTETATITISSNPALYNLNQNKTATVFISEGPL